MNLLLQYHNYRDRGLPIGDDPEKYFVDWYSGIETSYRFAEDEVGSQVFLIVGIRAKPMRYLLWETFKIEEVTYAPKRGLYIARGHGWMLNPPQFLEGKDFDQFRKDCANFTAFKRIGDLPYAMSLKKLADEFHRNDWDGTTLDFCKKLSSIIPDDDNVEKLLLSVATYLGYDIYDVELERVTVGLPQPPEEPDESVPLWTLQAIKLRRGQPLFRRALIEAYGGCCAITGCDAEPALEAAHILPYDGEYTNVVQNGLLLRGDVHTLFDLDLIRINPDSMAVEVDESLSDTQYATLNGTQLRVPNEESLRPNPECFLLRAAMFSRDNNNDAT